MIAAVGPFTTSDGLGMEPLHDLLKIVKTERPNILLLVGYYTIECVHNYTVMVCFPIYYRGSTV